MTFNIIRHTRIDIQGFTLVELLVVMGVVGILAAGLIALINPADRINQSSDSKALADLNAIVGGLNANAAAGATPGVYVTVAAGTNIGDGTNGAAKGFGPVQALLTNELNANPTSINTYNYAYNCGSGSPQTCKMSVQLKSKKNLNGANFAAACWTIATGVKVLTGATLAAVQTTGTTCP